MCFSMPLNIAWTSPTIIAVTALQTAALTMSSTLSSGKMPIPSQHQAQCANPWADCHSPALPMQTGTRATNAVYGNTTSPNPIPASTRNTSNLHHPLSSTMCELEPTATSRSNLATQLHSFSSTVCDRAQTITSYCLYISDK